MDEYGSLPRARQDGLLEETVGEELLLYDQNSHTAHCLSPVAACVWRHCDGECNVTELAKLAGVSESLATDALRELREKDLLAAEPELMQSAVERVSRRQVIVRGARYGAAAAAVPLIVSATAATPAMASSGEEEMVVGNYECGGVSTKNCCDCVEVCIYNSPKTKEQCKTECIDKYAGYVNYKANSVCVKV